MTLAMSRGRANLMRWLHVIVVLAVASPALAQTDTTLSGRWSAGVLRTAWTLADWGDACGPSPVGGNEAGGLVAIRQTGNELTIEGLGRPFSSASCWDQQQGVSRASHTGQIGRWMTTCKSAPNDPRRTTITTTLVGTGSSLDMDEVGQYEVAIAGRSCSANVRRTRHFTLIEREGTAPEASASAASLKPVSNCAPPGPASRLESSPSYKLLKPGDKFTFHAKVFDEHGCPLTQKVNWRLAKPSFGAELDASGTLSLRADAAEGELQIRASVGEPSVQVTVYVVSAERYQQLLSSPSFNGAGESDAKVVQSLPPNVVGTRAPLIDPTARRRRTFFVWAVATLAALMGAGAFLVTRIRRDRMPIQSDVQPEEEVGTYSASVVQPARTVSHICPVCGAQYGSETQFCAKDGALLVPIN